MQKDPELAKHNFHEHLNSDNNFKKILLTGSEKEQAVFLEQYVLNANNKVSFDPEKKKVYLVPSERSTLATFIAAHDPLYRTLIF